MKIRSYSLAAEIADIELQLKEGWHNRHLMNKKRCLEKEMYDLDVDIDRVKADHHIYIDLLNMLTKDLSECRLKLQQLESSNA